MNPLTKLFKIFRRLVIFWDSLLLYPDLMKSTVGKITLFIIEVANYQSTL